MSSNPQGPLFKPEGKEFFVVTNIGANADFKNSGKTNNSIQFIGSQWEKLRMVEPEGTQEVIDSKGKIILAFEGTTAQNPGQLYLDADIVAKTGYQSPEGLASAVFIANSDPVFYNPNDFDGSSSSNTSASTSTKVNLTGSGWVKGGIAGSQFKQAVEEYRAENQTTTKNLAFDVYANITPDGLSYVEVFVEKAITVQTGVTPLTNYVDGGEYDIFQAIGDFGGFTLSNEFDDINQAGLVTLTETNGKGGVAFGNDDVNEVAGSTAGDAIDAGGGNDNLDGGGGADRLTGGAGNDTIKGGADGDKYKKDGAGNDLVDSDGNKIEADVWEYGDRAVYKGKKSDYTITENNDGTFTVKDNNTSDGDDGTDTLESIEILEFADDSELLVTKTESYTYTDWATGKTVSEEFVKGTEFDDVIQGADGKSVIRGKAGNDVIKGDGSTGQSKDMIEGGAGNDFIDGMGKGKGVMPWENDNVAEFFWCSPSFYRREVSLQG